MTTCTIGPDAVTGKRCGAPAVIAFTGRNGERFAECAAHVAPTLVRHNRPVVGAVVTVEHAGLHKAGIVTAVRKTRAEVRVALADGTAKLITRPIAELVVR